MSARPSNWHTMQYSEQRAWEKQERDREDAEYESERARDEAERARRSLSSARDEIKRTRESANAHHDDMQEEMEQLQGQLLEAQDVIVMLERQRDFLRDFVARKGEVVEFLAWFRTTTLNHDGTPMIPDIFKGVFDPVPPADADPQ